MAQRRSKPAWADLGLNPLAGRLIALHAMTLVIGWGIFWWLGLSIGWSPKAVIELVILASVLGLWLHFYFVPGNKNDHFVAEVVLVVFLMLEFTAIGSPVQYAAVAFKFPYADPWLAAADARLGVNVQSLAVWTRAHPLVSRLMTASYFSLMPQFLATLLGLAALRERERLWEYTFHFHACLAIALACLFIWPAVCPPDYYGFSPTIGMTHLIGQIKGFHEGSMHTVRFDELDGLVSFPSFHVAGGFIVVWAFRGRRWIQVPLVVLNVAMIVSTFVTGVHYVTDVLGAVPLFGASLAAYRWSGSPSVRT